MRMAKIALFFALVCVLFSACASSRFGIDHEREKPEQDYSTHLYVRAMINDSTYGDMIMEDSQLVGQIKKDDEWDGIGTSKLYMSVSADDGLYRVEVLVGPDWIVANRLYGAHWLEGAFRHGEKNGVPAVWICYRAFFFGGRVEYKNHIVPIAPPEVLVGAVQWLLDRRPNVIIIDSGVMGEVKDQGWDGVNASIVSISGRSSSPVDSLTLFEVLVGDRWVGATQKRNDDGALIVHDVAIRHTDVLYISYRAIFSSGARKTALLEVPVRKPQ